MAKARTGPVKTPPQVQIGDLNITLLDGGHLWLDGGAMFGIIPKPIWSGRVEVDEANRIPLATTCFFVESRGKRVLIETGSGDPIKYPAKERAFFRFADHWLLDSLMAAGIERQSIDYVILTHLHFDHAGGGTLPDGRGGYELTFPNAHYVVQRGEWEDARSGYTVMTGSYREENLVPLDRADNLSLVNGEAEIIPGLTVRPFPGHTRHQQGVLFSSGEHHAVLPADLMPTSAHLGLRYNMGYDLLPYENMRNKRRLLDEATQGGWPLLLGQDPGEAFWRVDQDAKGRYTLIPAS